jgi:hypothetical protein
MTIDEILRAGPVMPVVVIDDAAHAVPLARALVAGGIRAIEITLRTGAALDAVQAISREVRDAIPGVGTALTGADVLAALEAGARFIVSPGATPALTEAAIGSGLPFLPGVATASELARPTPAPIWPCPTCSASAAPGSRPAMRSRPAISAGSSSWRGKRRGCGNPKSDYLILPKSCHPGSASALTGTYEPAGAKVGPGSPPRLRPR